MLNTAMFRVAAVPLNLSSICKYPIIQTAIT